MSGDMMQKGFVLQIPQDWNRHLNRKISVQLTPVGVRYYLVTTEKLWNRPDKETIRDISTQYGSLPRMLGRERNTVDFVRGRLVEHVRKFYPEFCIPDDLSETFAWAAFPMLGAAMKKNNMLRPPFAVNLQVATGLRTFSVKDMVSQIFGESPRQLQAAVSQSMIDDLGMININNLTLASILRGYLPPNEMAEVLKMKLNQEYIQQIDKRTVNAIRLLLRRFQPKRIMRLIQSYPEDNRSDMWLRDAGMQYALARRFNP